MNAPLKRRHWERQRQSIGDWEPSMVQQSHFDQTDVNAIVARFKRDGYLPPGTREPQYGDVSELNASLTDLVVQAQETESVVRQFQEDWTPAPPIEGTVIPSTEPPASNPPSE